MNIKEPMKNWAARYLVENPDVQNRLLRLQRGLKRSRARLHSAIKTLGMTNTQLSNVYHASIQKTGSQWIKAIWGDPRIRKKSGLAVYPQHRYEWNEFRTIFPKYHFVPGLYISYQAYQEIEKPSDHLTFYVIRDPREVVVSWYFSMLESHRMAGRVPMHRENLSAMSEDRGIEYAIRELSLKFAFMRSWVEGACDEVIFVRFKKMVQAPTEHFTRLFESAGIPIDADTVADVVNDYTKESMRAREKRRPFLMKRRINGRSHYTVDRPTWQDMFNTNHERMFKDMNGNLVERLGYQW